MTETPAGETERALATSLAAALERALTPGASSAAVRAARDAASLLSLDPLDVLLGEFETRAGAPWPPELEPVRERLLRTAARCRAEGSLAPFREAGGEWAALGGELAAIEWTEMPALGRDVATLAVARALDELAFEEVGAATHRARLAAPVAASLRAALDWLAGSAGFQHPLRVRAEESAVEVAGEGLDVEGLDAAERVLAAMDGSLGPTPRHGERGWILRVPAVAPRDHFLMLEQGPLRLAIPWHSVLKLQTIAANELEPRARAQGCSLVPPLAPLATSPHERPVVTIAHGLRRGWVVADRVIWRLAADPCGAADPAATAAGLDRAVRTLEGETYAVAPAWILLGAAPASGVLMETLAARAREVAPPAPVAAVVAPALVVAPAPDHPIAPPARVEAPAPAVLDASHVTALDEPDAPAPAPSAEPGTLTALVVDDAFASQAFLARALADRGFEVAIAERARDLDPLIESRAWSLVLLDVDLPDASGPAFLRAALERFGRQATPPAVVALVRDAHDLAAAGEAGLADWLEKPVDESSLVRMIERLAAARRLSA